MGLMRNGCHHRKPPNSMQIYGNFSGSIYPGTFELRSHFQWLFLSKIKFQKIQIKMVASRYSN
jgi:hypothetical protein